MKKNKINILSEKILKKIFYEVTINDYSSIIKELVENSIDANSKNISIYIENYNYSFTVVDDGIGMSYDDLIICFLKGTTSKIKKEKDLLNIKTIGYRGNALYSISNISIMEIITKIKNNKLGYKLIIEYGKIIKKIPFFCNKGTSFTVNNIFLNLKNKKNFLSSNKLEYNKILNILYKIIICYNNINFKLFHNNKLIFNYNKSNLEKRIYNVFFKKKKYNKNIFFFKKKKYKKLTIKILIFNKKNIKKKLNFIFVNKKFIINNNYYLIINKFLLKYNKKKINYFFFIKINNKYININILPDKTKIIFNKKIKINKIIINFLKELINKNYFLNKKYFKKFFKKKEKNKKKKKIYNIKELNYINNFFLNFKEKKIHISKIDKNYILIINNNNNIIINIKRIKEKILYNFYKKKIFFIKKKPLLKSFKINLPYFFLKKDKIKLKKLIKKYFIFFYKKKKLYIKYIPLLLNNNFLIKIFNIIFLFFKKKKFKKFNIKKILLFFFIKKKKIKKIKINNNNIKNILLKIIKYKNFYISPKKKKIFFLIKKKLFK
ncbi:MAG: DNA mismatch repair endonuclease MutL [Candidatus Shikimatogenerans bostrichidophilus]|nr:MAG: DNA mismatch repair endonuclease MutL [Candidatus Shikimatogenerans bostrichidophilus]